jgi:small subunit ribosomal protein S16
MQIDEARALYWLGNGAKPSDAVEHILTKLGTTGRYQRLRSGEDINALVAEAEAEAQARPLNLKTRHDGQPVIEEAPPPKKGRGKAKAKVVEEAPVAEPESEVEEVPAAEAEANNRT